MTFGLVGLLLGAAMAAPNGDIAHSARIDHRTGAVHSDYTADVQVTHQQIGTVGVGGRPSTLRCLWRAGLVVERQARHESGSTLARSFTHDKVIEGSRPGWCSAQKTAIAQEVASRNDALQARLVQLAQEDHPVLHAEIDRMHGTMQAG
ncbi:MULTISPECIES: hypothetical protein [Sphingomonas]|jgi:hypothetical protein|uniref:Secreted protein n=1 Tax=Sphingomonas hankookensis TaxID=563996 RepID=A0ABR5YCP9_9SPHN|nr:MULTISPECIES: hypothetical protein [Sphingomonas]KZE15336.1 hypothetical protein AVT10_03080 [Sphingomonas hankookensis]PZT96392.1 MAG: hypothetical protein DI625_00380 [Sphingomonas sp.]RSV30072.1 hypothetical protein CA237_08435 [Sphingomonas sp. ABOLH]WCP71022.1 hypothetical protein PPZ50_11660 [Sphingomonas hankookensis]